ncbi:unnamed protein product [Rhizophagus irregularis]|nr:unnamed protein product [Rhizophagus irregularis]
MNLRKDQLGPENMLTEEENAEMDVPIRESSVTRHPGKFEPSDPSYVKKNPNPNPKVHPSDNPYHYMIT